MESRDGEARMNNPNDALSKEVKAVIKDFDEKYVVSNIILLGMSGEIRNIEVGLCDVDEEGEENE